MKNMKYLFVLFMLTAFVANAQSKDEKAVAAAVETLHKGIVDPEKSLLDGIVSEGLSYGHSGGKVQNKAEFIDDQFNGAFNFSSITPADQIITVSGKNAIVRHVFIAKATNAGVPTDIRIGNLMVWRKEGGSWRLLARQAFRL
ncbi:nuclear transport factor 2 family protein [Daejeonella sp.]|uniref:nuclear transport factor 2 family protein n=1 Tax=Daejeonella sp. TaxID=2805397 RepID=UPI002730FF96|nr:nuclear transport factor 2 family protein [Daejeonella sp.]MDP2415283.1 nuclear transport factor 2 family protein [Daejeonella sp.]